VVPRTSHKRQHLVCSLHYMAIRNWFSRPLLSFQQLVTTHCCCAGAALACTHQRRTTLITPHSSYLIVTHVVEQVQLHRFFIGASSISLARTQHQKIRLQLHTCHTSLSLMLLNRCSCTAFSLAPRASVWLTRITETYACNFTLAIPHCHSCC